MTQPRSPTVFRLGASGRTFLFALAVPPLSGGVLDPQGPVAVGNAQILLNAVAIMMMIVVPTLLATLVFAWWFRASNKKATYLPNWAYSGRLELIIWGIPLLVILFLGGVTWIGSHDLDPARPLAGETKPSKSKSCRSIGNGCSSTRSRGIASVNELVVPAGVPLHFSLTSASVMNSFFVPQLGSMISTMNGMVTQLNLQGGHGRATIYGLSAQFSGDGFSDMHFDAARSPRDESFAKWVAQARKSAPASGRGRPIRARAAKHDVGALHLSAP